MSKAQIVVSTADSQTVLDALESLLGGGDNWHMVVFPVEAVVTPEGEKEDAEEDEKSKKTALREEIYQEISHSCQLSPDFITLTILSSLVAAIGLNTDNIAIVIGAMVIAPFLGPLLAFSFAAALGDAGLMIKSAKTALTGLSIGFAAAFGFSWLTGVNLDSAELMGRAVVELDSVTLALAAGAAAALSVASGLSSALVGVMVAVALLPPSVAIALFLSAGELELAGGAALLLTVNVVCVNFASQVVFVLKGIRPRTWLQRKSAKRSRGVNFFVWGVLLLALLVLIVLGTQHVGELPQ